MIDYGIDIPHSLECLDDTMFVENIEYGERELQSGIIIQSETMDYHGHFVRPRWAKVKYKANNIKDIEVGDYILLEHGNWSTSILANIDGKEQKIWYISPKSFKEGIIAISKTMPKHLAEYGIED